MHLLVPVAEPIRQVKSHTEISSIRLQPKRQIPRAGGQMGAVPMCEALARATQEAPAVPGFSLGCCTQCWVLLFEMLTD